MYIIHNLPNINKDALFYKLSVVSLFGLKTKFSLCRYNLEFLMIAKYAVAKKFLSTLSKFKIVN